MNIIKKKQLLAEAKMQTKALENLKKWFRNFIGFSTIGLVITYYGIQGSGVRFAFGIFGIITIIVCILAAIIINMGIKNGKLNVEKILELAERKKTSVG